MVAHTPTPWTTQIDYGRWCVMAGPEVVARIQLWDKDIDEADARFIVRAANAHEALVAALQIAQELLGRNNIQRPEIDAALALAVVRP